MNEPIEIFTDGSCHTQLCIGAWVAIIFISGKKLTLSGIDYNTTHNRMELTAVIEAMKHVQQLNSKPGVITIITDSQYVTGLPAREQKFTARNFKTEKAADIRNADLVKELLELVSKVTLVFVKIKAHQKLSVVANYNIEADKLSRSLVRQAVKEL